MKNYRVTIWATHDIAAHSKEQAENDVFDLFVNGAIRNNDFVVEAEETETKEQ